MENAARRAGRPTPRLLAVSKTQPAAAVARLADAGQSAFGENYVQEALAKIKQLGRPGLEWHLIGHLQSNKCREVAAGFDWVQSLDRLKLVESLDRHRAPDAAPLNILIQVNPDGEAGKSGCKPGEIVALAAAVAAASRLRLRGLMAIPEPTPELARRRASFERMAQFFSALQATHPDVDTLSMGMSEDFELAIDCGASMIRVGTALFGPRG
ncbi:MAG: YggS family pyridoxal phosphate-dependent enzyme [Arenimonas sp.]